LNAIIYLFYYESLYQLKFSFRQHTQPQKDSFKLGTTQADWQGHTAADRNYLEICL